RVSGPDSASAKSAGTLVFGAEQGGGPDWCLNLILDVDCNAFWNVVFQTPVIRGAFLFTPKFTYKPDLVSKFKFQTRPQRITYTIRKNAKWSDGVPVTGKDFKFTWKTTRDPKNKDHIDPLGYEDIRSVTGSGKVVKITFKRNFAAWRDLFNYVLPQHALQGTDMLSVWNTCICNPKKGNAPIGDGPFLLTRYDSGTGITLTRNPHAWFGPKAKLQSIVFRFITNTNSEIQSIRSGEVDAIYPQPQLALADLRSQAGLRVVSHVGLQFEHIEIQQGPHGNPLAKQLWVRKALSQSINRASAAKALYGTLNPSVGPLQSIVRLKGEAGYRNDFASLNYSPAKVEAAMKAHNCSRGGDGIYTCSGTKVAFDFASTTGNALRTLAFTIFQDQAAKAGIQLRNAFVPAGTLFGSKLPAHDFDLAMFTYLVTVDPHYNVSSFSCGNASNYTEYCNRQVTRWLSASDKELNPAKRLALVTKAGKQIASDAAVIPLYQRPTYLVYKTSVHGMVDNASSQGPSFNAENWSKG
ncbi:MAG TPA: peptide ABC transporter substrate-binding protein, partial [Flavobacteriales bacterium]|nr:peptide ABC transporter substrate-binding protein [Flavobacteriales bacterium]